MEKTIQTYHNKELGSLKVILKDGETWFSLSQVCKTLGIKNPSQVIADIKQRRKNAKIPGVGSTEVRLPLPNQDGIIQQRKITIIPENILYALIFRSRKDKALRFQAWVTDEILPSIKKYGEYRTTSKIIRKSLTDTIRDELPETPNKKFFYSHFTNLTYKIALNKSAKELKGDFGDKIRENLQSSELKKVSAVENIIQSYLELGLNYAQIKEKTA